MLHTLLFENRSFTPRPVSVCVIVLYSPSSSSLMAYKLPVGEGVRGGGGGGEG